MSTAALKAAAAGGNGNGTAVAKTFPQMINTLKAQVALALPKHMNADRMARIALTEFNKNPALAKCDPRTVFASVIIASQMGLEIGIAGQGYLVPYKTKCQFVPGWKGLVDLAQRSGRSSVWTGAVYEGDEFEYEYGSAPYIKHRPAHTTDDPDALRYVYAVGRIKGSDFPIIEVWEMPKIWAHRDRFNKVGNDHYSFRHPEMYARKIPLLQVLKYMPASIELSLALDLDQAAETTGQNLDLKQAIDGTFSAIEPEPEPEPQAQAQAEPQHATIVAGGDQIPVAQAWIDTFRGIEDKARLAEAWKNCVAHYKAANLTVSLPVEAVYNERRELLS